MQRVLFHLVVQLRVLREAHCYIDTLDKLEKVRKGGHDIIRIWQSDPLFIPQMQRIHNSGKVNGQLLV